jgi:hypothetical protein
VAVAAQLVRAKIEFKVVESQHIGGHLGIPWGN